MSDENSGPGAPPSDGQEPALDPVEYWKKEAKRAKREAQNLRKRAEEEAGAAQRATADAEAQRLAEQQKYKELAEQHAATIARLEADRDAFNQRVQQRLINSRLDALLAEKGITDPSARALLLPGLRATVDVSVTDDLDVEGDFTAALETASALFSAKSNGNGEDTPATNGTSATDAHRNASAASLAALFGMNATSPSAHQPPPQDPRQRLMADMMAGPLLKE
jgi:hypothetical protein